MPRFESIQEIVEKLQENFRPDVAEGVEGVIQLDYTGEGGGQYYLIVQGRHLEVKDGVHPDPDTTVQCDAQTWLNIANGKTNPMTAMLMGKLKLKGSMPLALKFQKMFGLG